MSDWDEGFFWIAKEKPAHEFLNPLFLGSDVHERLEETLGDDIGGDCERVQLSDEQQRELGNLIIDYVKRVGGFRMSGFGEATQHMWRRK